MRKRIVIAAALVSGGVLGICLALVLTKPVAYEAEYARSQAFYLLFGPAAWIIPLSAFLGILVRAMIRGANREPTAAEGKILRHDEHMFFSHWCHALCVFVLAASGMVLGTSFLSRLVHTPEATAFALNVHFVGVVMFVLSLFYRISDLAINEGLKDLLPGTNDMKDAFSYYGSKVGMGAAPTQGKFLAREKLSFPLWLIIVAGISITGGIKVAAHVWSLSSELLSAMTFLHDICAVSLLVLLALHIVLGTIVPWSWPLVRSMVTGYMDEAHVRENHALWYKEIQEKKDV